MTTLQIAVIGGGPAAISAVMWLERLGHSPLWFCDTELGGSRHTVFNPILDFPPQTYENGAQLASSLSAFAKPFATKPLGLRATAVRLDSELIVVNPTQSRTVGAVIIATGTTYRSLRLPNEEELQGRLLFRSCSKHKDEFAGKDVLVVGGGDAAFEGALLLHGGHARPTLAVRAQTRARQSFVELTQRARIPVLTQTRVIALRYDPNGCRVSLDVAGVVEERVFAAVFVRIGVTPNTPELPEVVRDDEGYLVVDSRMRTSNPAIFAVGDVRSSPLRSVATAMGDGAIAAASIHASITSKTC